MKPVWFSSGIALGFFGVALGRRWIQAHADRMAELDAHFHAAYESVRNRDARRGPVLVLMGESLILYRGEQHTTRCASASATKSIRAAAHTPVGMFVALHERATSGDTQLDPITLARLEELRRMQREAQKQLQELDGSARESTERVLSRSSQFIDRVLDRGRVSAAELSQFAAEVGPALLGLIDHATRLELGALHRATEDILREVPVEERRALEVVVAGVHQARARSLGLQYFQKRFGEAPGEEKRVVYAESTSDATEARELVGTRRLDREIAEAFFGDPKRLQRDVLGDAAARRLEHFDLEPIG